MKEKFRLPEVKSGITEGIMHDSSKENQKILYAALLK
jgi:hypothetical protein